MTASSSPTSETCSSPRADTISGAPPPGLGHLGEHLFGEPRAERTALDEPDEFGQIGRRDGLAVLVAGDFIDDPSGELAAFGEGSRLAEVTCQGFVFGEHGGLFAVRAVFFEAVKLRRFLGG